MNERMTKRDTDGQAMMDCEKCKADWTGKHGKPMADCTALYCRNRLLDRVVEYEDTGWTPKEVTALGELFNYALKESKTLTEQLTLLKHLRELAEADKDGRVVVLPCKGYSSIDIARDGVSYRPDHWNIYLTAYAHEQNTPSGLKVGLFDIGEVERAMEEMEGRS